MLVWTERIYFAAHCGDPEAVKILPWRFHESVLSMRLSAGMYRRIGRADFKRIWLV